MRQSCELHCWEGPVVATDWLRSRGTKAGVFTSSREGKSSDVLALVLAIFVFAQVLEVELITTSVELITTKLLTAVLCHLISRGTFASAYCRAGRLGSEILDSSSLFVKATAFFVSCKAIVSFNLGS